jgi:hypothetical protein
MPDAQMTCCPTTGRIFLSTARRWIEANGEILMMIRYHAICGARAFEFLHSLETFERTLQDIPPRTCVIVFRDRQLPLRGRVDEGFIHRAREMMREGEDFLIDDLEKTTVGAASWFDNAVVETHDELLKWLRDGARYGKAVACGPHPPWLEDNNAVISAVVPNEDGSVTAGAY